MHKIFTYGSLRKGFHNHGLLRDSEFLGQYHTGPGYIKVPGPGFPFLIPDPEGPGTYGELYSVTDLTLEMLDRLEGHPHFYVRTMIDVSNLENTTKAYAYLMPLERLTDD